MSDFGSSKSGSSVAESSGSTSGNCNDDCPCLWCFGGLSPTWIRVHLSCDEPRWLRCYGSCEWNGMFHIGEGNDRLYTLQFGLVGPFGEGATYSAIWHVHIENYDNVDDPQANYTRALDIGTSPTVDCGTFLIGDFPAQDLDTICGPGGTFGIDAVSFSCVHP
jgi:hypothetical protein